MRSAIVALVVAAVVGWVAPTVGAAAQDGPELVVGVVDWEGTIARSKVGKDLKAQVDALGKKLEQDIAKEEKALRDKLDKLQQDRASLSDDELKAKKEELQAQYDKSRKDLEAKAQALNKKLREAEKKVRDALVAIVAEEAKKRKLTMVLNSNTVIFFHPDYDLTAAALATLDKKLPKVKISP